MPSSVGRRIIRSEEHTSELQSHDNLVCRLLLAKKIVCSSTSAAKIAATGPNNVESGDGALVLYFCGHHRDLRSFPCLILSLFSVFFFFNDTGPPEISPFSLHDALPI